VDRSYEDPARLTSGTLAPPKFDEDLIYLERFWRRLTGLRRHQKFVYDALAHNRP